MHTKRIDLPRCDEMDGSSLRILPRYTESGYFCEANVVWITDGTRTAVYVPLVKSEQCDGVDERQTESF